MGFKGDIQRNQQYNQQPEPKQKRQCNQCNFFYEKRFLFDGICTKCHALRISKLPPEAQEILRQRRAQIRQENKTRRQQLKQHFTNEW